MLVFREFFLTFALTTTIKRQTIKTMKLIKQQSQLIKIEKSR